MTGVPARPRSTPPAPVHTSGPSAGPARPSRLAPVAGALVLAVVLGGCTNFGGGTTNSGAGGTISTTARCQQLHNALQNLAGVSHTNWNKPISELPPATRDALIADGLPPDQQASAAYAQLVGDPEWSAC